MASLVTVPPRVDQVCPDQAIPPRALSDCTINLARLLQCMAQCFKSFGGSFRATETNNHRKQGSNIIDQFLSRSSRKHR